MKKSNPAQAKSLKFDTSVDYIYLLPVSFLTDPNELIRNPNEVGNTKKNRWTPSKEPIEFLASCSHEYAFELVNFPKYICDFLGVSKDNDLEEQSIVKQGLIFEIELPFSKVQSDPEYEYLRSFKDNYQKCIISEDENLPGWSKCLIDENDEYYDEEYNKAVEELYNSVFEDNENQVCFIRNKAFLYISPNKKTGLIQFNLYKSYSSEIEDNEWTDYIMSLRKLNNIIDSASSSDKKYHQLYVLYEENNERHELELYNYFSSALNGIAELDFHCIHTFNKCETHSLNYHPDVNDFKGDLDAYYKAKDEWEEKENHFYSVWKQYREDCFKNVPELFERYNTQHFTKKLDDYTLYDVGIKGAIFFSMGGISLMDNPYVLFFIYLTYLLAEETIVPALQNAQSGNDVSADLIFAKDIRHILTFLNSEDENIIDYNNCCQQVFKLSDKYEMLEDYLESARKEREEEQIQEQQITMNRLEKIVFFLTVIQAFFALVQYLGIRGLIGDPAGFPWTTVSLICFGILLVWLAMRMRQK